MKTKTRHTKRDRVLWIARLYKRRIKIGLSRLELSRLLNIPYGTIRSWERSFCLPPYRNLEHYEKVMCRCEHGEIVFTPCPAARLLKHTESPELKYVPRRLVDKLAARRKELGLNCEDITKRMKRCRGFWWGIENGRRHLLWMHYDEVRAILYNSE